MPATAARAARSLARRASLAFRANRCSARLPQELRERRHSSAATTIEFSAQKFFSAMRNSARQPNHPSAIRLARISSDQSPITSEASLSVTMVSHRRRRSAQGRAGGPGTHQQQDPGDDQLGQADLDQQAAGQRQHRAALGAGGVVLDIAMARIDDQACAARAAIACCFLRLAFPAIDRSQDLFGLSGGAPESSVATQRLDGN